MTDPAPTATAVSPLASLKDSRLGPVRRRRRRWPWVLLVLALAAGGAALWMPRQLDVQASAVMTAYPSARYAQLTASGYVVAQRRASVASKATGRVVELKVREGSVLKAGDLIARLDAADVQAAIAAADAGTGAGPRRPAAGPGPAAARPRSSVATPTPNCSVRWAWCSRVSCRRRRWTRHAGAPTRRRPRWRWRRPASPRPRRARRWPGRSCRRSRSTAPTPRCARPSTAWCW
jgi:hypothetical protein